MAMDLKDWEKLSKEEQQKMLDRFPFGSLGSGFIPKSGAPGPSDWRGAEDQEKLCNLAEDPQRCIRRTNNALRPVLDPKTFNLAGEITGENLCDYGQTNYDLFQLGRTLQEIQTEIINSLLEENKPIPKEVYSSIKIGELAAQVVAERMVQECQCKT